MNQTVSSPDAPKAIGPYSQAVRAGQLLFLSGQVPLDPGTGQIVSGDIAAQTRRVLDNLKAVLAAAGLSFADIVRTTIFLADMNDFAAVNEVYGHVLLAAVPGAGDRAGGAPAEGRARGNRRDRERSNRPREVVLREETTGANRLSPIAWPCRPSPLRSRHPRPSAT